MKFGPVPVGESLGGIVAHAVRRDGLVLKKGDTVNASHVAALQAAGIGEIVVALLDPGDVGEDSAAKCLAERIAGQNLRVDRAFTGRANLFAESAGILCLDADMVARVNDVDEAVTLATLPAFRTVVAGEMVATVKIIPFAVAGAVLDGALAAAGGGRLSIAPFKPLAVGVVSTILPGLKTSVVDKTLRVLNDRLRPAGAHVVADERVPHETRRLAEVLGKLKDKSDLTIVFGASAITDRRDVIPAAIEAAGGRIDHFGMPVDPGNLLLIGELDRKPVLGAPGCARSPKENGFDWVLHRLLAGVPVTSADIRRMGTGGLLMEIISRPQPRGGGGPSSDGELVDDHG
ncbi:MAG: molybdopterin-binding protein [Methylobacteriaceae bacterium]|nr:molybdopterin-binding protein [Methylobacteriaceae bacterium]